MDMVHGTMVDMGIWTNPPILDRLWPTQVPEIGHWIVYRIHSSRSSLYLAFIGPEALASYFCRGDSSQRATDGGSLDRFSLSFWAYNELICMANVVNNTIPLIWHVQCVTRAWKPRKYGSKSGPKTGVNFDLSKNSIQDAISDCQWPIPSKLQHVRYRFPPSKVQNSWPIAFIWLDEILAGKYFSCF